MIDVGILINELCKRKLLWTYESNCSCRFENVYEAYNFSADKSNENDIIFNIARRLSVIGIGYIIGATRT